MGRPPVGTEVSSGSPLESIGRDGGRRAARVDAALIRQLTPAMSAVRTVAEAASDEGSLTPEDLDAYLVHMRVHDAHHRGRVLVALKAAGRPLTDEDELWRF